MSTVFQRVGPYEILHEIGRGGMAVVFLATDDRTDRRVALRLVSTGREHEADGTLDAERWGAKLQEQFCEASPRVPRVYEHNTEDGYFYIAMEYLEGQNLSEVIAGGPMPPPRAIAIAIQLCDFLEAAHAFEATIDGRQLRSLLHGDLKPRNIRVLEGDEIKILDFGIAKALSLSRKVTRNDFGSIAYLSPERLESGDIDAQADFWAVGVLLYEMVSGSPPFQAPDTRRLEQLIKSCRPPAPLDDRCPDGLKAIVAKLLAGNPVDRYATASAIRDDLRSVASGEQTQAERDGWPARALDEPPTRRTHPPQDSDEEPTRRAVPASAEQQTTIGPSVTTARIAAAPTPPPVKRARRLLWRFAPTVLLLMAVIFMWNQLSASNAAQRLAAVVPTQELDAILDTWHEYDALRARSTRMAIDPLRHALTDQTMVLAERVFGNYRTPQPTVREAQWKTVRDAVAEALRASPGDARLRAAVRYCDGHLHRINGEARKVRKRNLEAQREFTDAVSAFREAAELRPDWPDPFLGLMRTFIYGLEDVDRGADALNQAQRLGYSPSDRETAQLADGYRARAETLVRTARTLVGAAQEHEYLTRARDAYRQSIDLYSKVIDYADVPRIMRGTQRRLEQIEEQLDRLSSPPSAPNRSPNDSSASPSRNRPDARSHEPA